jgi:competence protein ComEC
LLFGLAFVWIHNGPPPPPQGRATEAAVVDVGQGLAVALRDSSGGTALLDAGGSHVRGYDPGETIVVPFLLHQGIRRIDVLVVTHDDLDHAGGTFAVVRQLEVGELWLGPGFGSSPLLAELVDLAQRRGTAVVGVSAGMVSAPGQVALRVLAPARLLGPAQSNARSLALLAGTAPTRLLVPGDADHAAERAMLERGEPVRAEALVLGHHGSRHSSAKEFLSAVDPRYAIVSAGRGNPFRHPHVETLDRVRESGARLLRTDRDGWIRLRARPDGWTVAPGTAR